MGQAHNDQRYLGPARFGARPLITENTEIAADKIKRDSFERGAHLRRVLIHFEPFFDTPSGIFVEIHVYHHVLQPILPYYPLFCKKKW